MTILAEGYLIALAVAVIIGLVAGVIARKLNKREADEEKKDRP